MASWVLSQQPLWLLYLYQLCMYRLVYYVSNLFKSLWNAYYYYIIILYIVEFCKVFISFLSQSLKKWAVKKKALLINSEPVWWGPQERKMRRNQWKDLVSQQHTEGKGKDKNKHTNKQTKPNNQHSRNLYAFQWNMDSYFYMSHEYLQNH